MTKIPMFKKILSFVLIVFLSTTASLSARAQTVTLCNSAVVTALDNTMGSSNSASLSGYFKQLSDLMSTNTPTYLLIDEAQQLARDARIELRGICQEAGRFNSMDVNYVVAYDLQACKAIQANSQETELVEVTNNCVKNADDRLTNFLDSLRLYMLKQAVRTSVEPMVQRMRSLNARLTVLLAEFSRVVSNFYTFNFRLGDTIIGERD